MKLTISLCPCLAIMCTFMLADATEWIKLADLPTSTALSLSGRGISSMAGGVINNQLFLIGGQEGSYGGDIFDTKSTRIFSPKNNTWTFGKDAPDFRERAASVVSGDTIYIIGGAKAGEELVSYVNNWSYTPSTDSWKELASLPDTSYDAAACSVNETIYLFGGYPSNDDVPIPYNTTLIYSTISNMWSQGRPLPLSVGEATCVTVGTDIYLFGGKYYADEQYSYSNQVQIYDTVKNTWSKGDLMPQTMGQFSSTLIGNKVFFISSENTQPQAYDLTKKKWLDDYPKLHGNPRISPGVMALQNTVYVIGGQMDLYTDKEYSYLYSNETLVLDL